MKTTSPKTNKTTLFRVAEEPQSTTPSRLDDRAKRLHTIHLLIIKQLVIPTIIVVAETMIRLPKIIITTKIT